MKRKIFLDGPRAPRSTILEKRWGSGDENARPTSRVTARPTFRHSLLKVPECSMFLVLSTATLVLDVMFQRYG